MEGEGKEERKGKGRKGGGGVFTTWAADCNAYFGFRMRKACLTDRSTEGAWRAVGDSHSLFRVAVRVSTFRALLSCAHMQKGRGVCLYGSCKCAEYPRLSDYKCCAYSADR